MMNPAKMDEHPIKITNQNVISPAFSMLAMLAVIVTNAIPIRKASQNTFIISGGMQ